MRQEFFHKKVPFLAQRNSEMIRFNGRGLRHYASTRMTLSTVQTSFSMWLSAACMAFSEAS